MAQDTSAQPCSGPKQGVSSCEPRSDCRLVLLYVCHAINWPNLDNPLPCQGDLDNTVLLEEEALRDNDEHVGNSKQVLNKFLWSSGGSG